MQRSTTAKESEEDPLLKSKGAGSRNSFWGWFRRLKPVFVILGILLWIYIGYAYARDVEGWSALTAIYVIVQIVTTVGYGDITVSTEEGKFFMAIYVVFTILILGAIVTDCVDSLLQSGASSTLRKHIEKVHKIKNNHYRSVFLEILKDFEHLIVAGILFAIFVAFGTIFYATFEKCTCSYGVSHVTGCIDTADAICEATGGYVKTWTDAFYMSVITLTTVGFGDHAPRSDVGRTVGCVWMLFGVVATANFASAFGALLIGAQKNDHRLGKMSEDIFQKIDKNKDNEIDRREFRTYALLKFGLVTYEDLDEIDNLFDAIDTDGSGTLSHDEVFTYCDTE
jgi:potassium channel subfamily K